MNKNIIYLSLIIFVAALTSFATFFVTQAISVGGDLNFGGQYTATNIRAGVDDKDAVSLEQATDLVAAGSGGGTCYTVYGSNSCADGYTKVVDGYTTMYSYDTGTNMVGELVCSPETHTDRSMNWDASFVMFTRTGYYDRVYNESCSICCK